MMIDDETLQNNIDRKIEVGKTPDSIAYKKVFEILERDQFFVPSDFADKVVVRIESRRNFVKDYFWIAMGIIVLIITAIYAGLSSNFKVDFGAYKFISGYTSLVAFLIILIGIFHWLDKAIIRKKLEIG